MPIHPIKTMKNTLFAHFFEKKVGEGIADSKNSRTFATAMTKWEVLYGQLLVNPPGLDRSKGSRS